MRITKSPGSGVLAIATMCVLGLSALALAAEPAESPPNDNRLLLTLIDKAMADDPKFRTELTALLARTESEQVETLRNDVADRDTVIRELRAEIETLRKEGSRSELGTQPVEQPVWVPGTLTIDNRCPYFVRVRINDQVKSIGPGRFQFPVTVDKAIGTVSTELVGFESPRSWTLTPPDYTTTFVIRP